MSQERLDFGLLHAVSDGARHVYSALNDAAERVGILNCAGACGVDRGDMRRALDRRDRGVWTEYAMAIGAIAPYQQRRDIAAAFVAPLGFLLNDAAPPMTDKERADRLEAVIAGLGPIAQEAARAALGGRR
jgi:hypothetical protein